MHKFCVPHEAFQWAESMKEKNVNRACARLHLKEVRMICHIQVRSWLTKSDALMLLQAVTHTVYKFGAV